MRKKINNVVFILIGLILLVSVIIYFVSSHEREPFAGSIYDIADTEINLLSRGDYRYVETTLGRYDTKLELGGRGEIRMSEDLVNEPGFNEVNWEDGVNISKFMSEAKLNVGDIIHFPAGDYVNVGESSFTPYRIGDKNILEKLSDIEFKPPPQEYTIADRSKPITDNDINVMKTQYKTIDAMRNSDRLGELSKARYPELSKAITPVDGGFIYDNANANIQLIDGSDGGKIITDGYGNGYTIIPGNSPRELLSEFSNKNLNAEATPENIRAKIAGETRLNVADTDVTLGRERNAKSSVINKGGLTETTTRLNDYNFPEDRSSFNLTEHDGPVRSVKLKMADGSEEVIGHIVERKMTFTGGLRSNISNYIKVPPDFIMDDGIFGRVEDTGGFKMGGSQDSGYYSTAVDGRGLNGESIVGSKFPVNNIPEPVYNPTDELNEGNLGLQK